MNDEHFEDLSDDSWNGVVDMIGTEEYVDKQIAKAKLGVDDLDKLQREYEKVIENEAEFQAALTIEEQQAKQSELLQKIEEKRETLISSVDDLDASLNCRSCQAPSAVRRAHSMKLVWTSPARSWTAMISTIW